MVSFFRRKKPEKPTSAEAERRIEALAAAFPDAAREQAPGPVADADSAEAETTPPARSQVTDTDTDTEANIGTEPVPAEVIAAVMDVEPVAVDDDLGRSAGESAADSPVDSVPTPPRDSLQPAPAGKPGWRERLRGSVFARSLGGLFSRNPKLDDDLLDEVETALITADVGVTATTQLVEGLRKRMKAREFADANALLAALRADLVAMLQTVAVPLRIERDAKPFVLLTVGVNGVGKTTTIGKLAKRFKDEGRTLMLAAGDTFRAAAVAQLQAWGERNGVTVIAQGQNADAASVGFDALQAARARGIEVLIADTAGRLHTQQGLMAELGKIKRVLQKLDPAAPHEVLMVIDGTTGQNALSQLRQFHAAVGVTGLVVTKLDGTAKGGVVFALAREFGIPIRYAGIGERPEDLRVFDAEAFVDALLPEALGA
jgi:fused signal recognition particle receptor